MPLETSNSPVRPFFNDLNETIDQAPKGRLEKILGTIRKHLSMDVAFISEFANGRRIFRYVDARTPDQPVKIGGFDPLEESYCQRIIDGRLPELIHDATQLPEALSLPATTALPVGAHLSVPLVLKDGAIYGTFCCFSFTPDKSLNDRDLSMMRVFADIAAEQIDQELESIRAKEVMVARINAVIEGEALSVVYQPIYRFTDNQIVGFESLSRFSVKPDRNPDVWFNEATDVGLGIKLETKAIKLALQGLRQLPTEVYISVNVSPECILDKEFYDSLRSYPLKRVVLEITEHSVIDHYLEIAAAIKPLRDQGLRLAVDDAGAGYASFRHILSLSPDVIKLDISITKDIDSDIAKRALARAIISFSEETNSKVVAEGVETASELAVLRELGINKAQGYFIGKPMPLENAVALMEKGIGLK